MRQKTPVGRFLKINRNIQFALYAREILLQVVLDPGGSGEWGVGGGDVDLEQTCKRATFIFPFVPGLCFTRL